MYSVRLTPTAEKFLENLHRAQPRIAERIAHVIDRLAKEPDLGIPLRGELKGCLKLRAGSYRIIYQVRRQELLIMIIDIGHRKDIYR